MRIIPTNIHAGIDYVIGLLMIAMPWLAGFADGGAATWVFVIVGAGAVAYSLFTDYEISLANMIGMRAHLAMDVIGGLFLIASPWLFGFAEYVFWPHVILGAIEVGTALMTQTARQTRADRHHHEPGHPAH